MNKFKHHITGLLAGFIYATLGLVPSYADDTEIYFGGSFIASDEKTRPNILFILDTSGSMAYNLNTNGGSSNERLNALKSAMGGLLQSANNVNIGLMRFTDAGGPVLHPVAYVDEVTGGLTATVSSQISDSHGDATEAVSGGAVSLTDNSLGMMERLGGASNVNWVVEDKYYDIAEEVRSGNLNTGKIILYNGTNPQSTDIELMRDTGNNIEQYVGIRFQPDTTVPLGAVIQSASLEMQIANRVNSDSLTIDIKGELNDSGQFSNTYYDVSSRRSTVGKVAWDVDVSPNSGQNLNSVDLSSLLQEMMDSRISTSDAMTFILEKAAGSNNGRREAKKDVRPNLRFSYSTSSEAQSVGLRFSNVAIPSQAVVTNAYIEFVADSSNSETANYTIAGDNVGDAAAFEATANNVRGRNRTTAQLNWNGVEPWVANQTYQTPNLSAVVQELVNGSDWCGGNAMAFILEGSMTGRRVAKSFDGGAGAAPRLVVEYETNTIPEGGGCAAVDSEPYQVSAGNDDAEQSNSSGGTTTSGQTLNLESDEKYAAVRFNGISVPQGSDISSAFLRFRTKNESNGSVNIRIGAQNTDNAPAFDGSDNDLSTRLMTNTVDWTLSNWDNNQDYYTVDVSEQLEAVVGRAGWAAGNSVVFRLEHRSGNDVGFATYNDNSWKAARLFVSYQTDNYVPTELRTVRDDLKSILDNEIIASGSTPIVETYHEAALYMRGDNVKYGKQRASSDSKKHNTRVSVPSSYTGGTVVRNAGCTDANLNDNDCKSEYISGNPTYNSPMEYSCQQNHIVLLTDGEPNDGNESINDIQTLTGKTCSISWGGVETCGVELADFLATEDQKGGVGNLAGNQTITTHTIALIGGQSSWLEEIATKGGGGYYPISGGGDVVAELSAAFDTIVGDVTEVDTSFAAPAVAISRFNRLVHRNEIYYAVFQPLETPNWPGNLKKFGLNSDTDIVDVNGALAVDVSSGAFKTDSRSYWSTEDDGNEVELGGAASQMPDPDDRKIYTYHSTSSSRDMTQADNLVVDTNSEITKAMLGIDGASNNDREDLIDWIRGEDIKNEDDDDNTDARFAIGDPLHSRPIVVTYATDPNGDGDPSDDEYYIFFGTNTGMLHAIDGESGEEQFALIPDDLLPNFKVFYDNQEGVERPYGLDGEPTVWVRDVDNDGNIEAADGDRVYLYVGMRRGGRNYYAYDITDIDTPKFLWKIEGGSSGADGDFSELGQSWSKPLLTSVRYKSGANAVTKPVLFFGGGYDDRQDDVTTRTVDSVGRAVYMVDAVTGELLWTAANDVTGNAEDVDEMLYSIPTQLAGADLNNDGVLDALFYGDMGGQLFRTDFDSSGTKSLSQFSSTNRIATVSDDTETGAGTRRFYHAPDIALTRNGSELYLTILIGSGYRAHPLNTTIVDRFYAIKQPIFTPGSNVNLTEDDLFDATSNELQLSADPQQPEIDAANAARAALEAAKGWYITMENSGEKVLSRPTVIEGTVLFTTYEPAAGVVVGCTPVAGQNRSYLVDVMDATAVINRDNVNGLTKADRSALLNVLGIVGEGTLVSTEENTELKCGTQDCGLELDGANTIRTFWFQEEQ